MTSVTRLAVVRCVSVAFLLGSCGCPPLPAQEMPGFLEIRGSLSLDPDTLTPDRIVETGIETPHLVEPHSVPTRRSPDRRHPLRTKSRNLS
jgi:hypothetical protein